MIIKLIFPARTAYIRIPDLQVMRSLTGRRESPHSGLLKWIDPSSLDILRPYSGIVAVPDWPTEQPASYASGVTDARMTFLTRLKAFPARLKATKETATYTGRSDGTKRITHVSDRPRLAMSSRRPPQ